MSDEITVLLADDDRLYRETVRTLIEATPGLCVVAEAGTGEETAMLVREHAPDVVLMDVRMPRGDGIHTTSAVIAAGSRSRILVLTTFDLDVYVYRALQAGAAGFLVKDTPPARLLDGIAVVAAGDALLAPSVTRRLIAELGPSARTRGQDGRLASVTERECEVLVLIARGLSNTEIEHALHISRSTLKTHIGQLLAKLHARDRAQLVIAAYETGLVDHRFGKADPRR